MFCVVTFALNVIFFRCWARINRECRGNDGSCDTRGGDQSNASLPRRPTRKIKAMVAAGKTYSLFRWVKTGHRSQMTFCRLNCKICHRPTNNFTLKRQTSFKMQPLSHQNKQLL